MGQLTIGADAIDVLSSAAALKKLGLLVSGRVSLSFWRDLLSISKVDQLDHLFGRVRFSRCRAFRPRHLLLSL